VTGRDKIIRLAAAAEHAEREVLSEDAVALAFTDVYRDQLLFDHDAGAWHKWDGARWRQERTRLAFDWARKLARELAKAKGGALRTRIGKVAFASGVEKFAQTDRAFAVTSDSWDVDPFLLATPDGTVDLRAGTLRAADPTDRISKLTAVAPARAADCPRWLAFLHESTGDDAAMVRFLQTWLGYCLTGDTREHQLVFLYGPGRNGKTVFLKTINGLLGDYATVASMDCFTASKSERHPTDLAMLRGARLVTAAETEEGKHWAESRIKQLTGGDPISARFMRQDFFTYTPTFKLTIIGNHTPNLHNVDEAERRRINIVPFILKPKNPDKALVEKLAAEWPGILRWMIEGCLQWQKDGLVPARAVTAATEEYFANQDLFGQWLEEKCDAEPGNNFKTATSAALFKSWSEFSKAAGEEAGSRKGFANLLKSRGFILERVGHGGTRGWSGLRLKPQDYD
jgi:putative DNA primase/helicase